MEFLLEHAPGGQTHLTLRHHGLPTEEMSGLHNQGWSPVLDNLEKLFGVERPPAEPSQP